MPRPIGRGQRYMPGLDGLRAIAVLAVIAYHLGLGWAPGGLLGVGVFFTLSGYLITDILLAPIYPPVWLAKATGSLHAISGGRLTLGLGVGGRADDFAAAQRPYDERGRLMDETLELLHRAWAGEPVAGGEFAVTPPVPGGRIPVLVGGHAPAAIRRCRKPCAEPRPSRLAARTCSSPRTLT